VLKKIIISAFCLILITGCNNKVEEEKNTYLEIKSILETTTDFSDSSSIPCDITITIDRIDDEKISYKTILNNPKENMNNIKLLIIHNQYTEEVFPSIGLLDNNVKVLNQEDISNEIIIERSLATTSDIKKLSLEFRIWLEYTDDLEEKHTIYYKTTI
jgi:hypothetical protein